MKVLTSKIVNGKKMFLIEDNNPQGKVFAQVGKPIKKENISNYNPYYVDVKGLNASESTKTNLTPATKITPQEIKKIKESPTNVGNIKIKEAQEKAQRLKEAEEAYKKRKAGAPITPELLAQETQAIGDKISLQNIPGVGQYIPDILDVTGGIGSMASGLGRIPLNIKNKEYGQAALSVTMPLGVGALAGVGTQNTGQFVNNLANPLAGTGEIIDNLGNKYLPNAYKLNPFAFKPNPEAYYHRSPNLKNIINQEKGILQGFGQSEAGKAYSELAKPGMGNTLLSDGRVSTLNLRKPANSSLYFSKGVPLDYGRYNPETFNEAGKRIMTGQGYPGPYMVEVENVPMGASTKGRLPGADPKALETYAVSRRPISLDEAKFYKEHWLKGYKEVPKPKYNFKSEINWGKWNKEIPENKALMQEYNTIEQQAKADGTWMKNPDGSAFQGTPEQFVQQNSENFKKSFGNSKLVNPDGSPIFLYHGSAKKFDIFDPSKFQLGDAGSSGSGIYTVPNKRIADSYALSSSSIHSGNKIPTVYQLYGKGVNPISSEEIIKNTGAGYPNRFESNQTVDLFNFHRKSAPKHEQLLDYDVAIHNQQRGIEKIRDWNDAWEIVFPTNKQLKSAIGNNGMFDMTNPNIYKTLIPGAMTLGALNQTNEKQFGGTIKVLDTKIEKNKKYYLINE